MTRWLSVLAVLAAALLLLAGGGASGAVDPSGCTTNDLGRGDDISSGAVSLPFAVNFFGTTYTSLYVNNNGNVTFDAALGDYTPAGMPNLHIPLIAPFFADVDTRNPNSGTVHYGETTVGDAKAFCVHWDNVGYFNTHANKTNNFQMLLVQRPDQAAGDFDIVLNYDQVQWETGDADSGVDGLGGLAAEVGLTNADQHFSMLGSQTAGAFLDSNPAGLVNGSFNSGGVLGRYVFHVRAGTPGLGQPVSGTVMDSGGNIVPDAQLQLCPLNGSGESCVTTNSRSDGSFTFVDVGDGSWNLVGFPPQLSGLGVGTRDGIQVNGAAVTGADLVLPDGPPAQVPANGSVETAAGDPIAGATVTVLTASTPAGPFLPVPDGSTILAPGVRANPTTTDAGGTFAFDAIAGYYKVQAQKDGCFAAGNQTFSYAESQLLTLPPAPSSFVLQLDCPAAPTDTTPPVITVPQKEPVEATGPGGATVTFAATANDDVDGSLPVTCTPASGSTFQLGTTPVDCYATDQAGNTGHDQFNVTVQDTTPPVLDLPVDAGGQAVDAAGGHVDYTATATDLVDGTRPVNCNPASGSLFPVGITQVDCSAADKTGNAASGHFDVTVTAPPAAKDTTPPVLTVPAPINANATGSGGAVVVGFTVTATDDTDGPRPVTCDPASGSVFSIGNTIVHCWATDVAGNTGYGQFTVHVAGAQEQLQNLIDVVNQQYSNVSGLASKLNSALASLQKNKSSTCRFLGDADKIVTAQTGKKLSPSQAGWLHAELARIARVLGC